jgi:predicted N-acetyltransferase YhbS
MEISYRPIEPGDYDKVRQLLIDVGWQERVQDTDRFEEMMRGASLNVVALEGARVIGFARALFDGASNGYISTVAVATDKQRQGIGQEMVRRLMDVEGPRKITWVLRSGRGSDGFWEKMGFKKSEVAMEKVREE